MSVPTHEEFLTSSARWNGAHHGIRYQLNWHGRSEYSPQGTWCYYIIVTSEQFYPDDWAKLRLEKQDKQFREGDSWHRHWAYENFPDVDFHGGPTFGEMSVYLSRNGIEHEAVKIGCDYAHLWDSECDYWQGKREVERDAKFSIERLIEKFPRRRVKCDYSGKFGEPEEFYTARNGRTVHKSYEAKLRADKWDGWWPAEDSALSESQP